jgi:hypothetical protein
LACISGTLPASLVETSEKILDMVQLSKIFSFFSNFKIYSRKFLVPEQRAGYESGSVSVIKKTKQNWGYK